VSENPALVVTPVAVPEVLAGTLRLAGAALPDDTVVVPTGAGAVVCATVPAEGASVLGEVVSRVLRDVPVVLVVREDDRLTAVRWTAGHAGETVPPGVLVSTLDDVVEALLLGRTAGADAPGAIEVARLGRWRAARMVASARRRR
jgi:hypothetical protein